MQNQYKKIKRKFKTLFKFYIPNTSKLRNYFKHKKSVFLVYTGGKVGSTTVYNILLKKMPFSRVYHLHALTERYLNLQDAFRKNGTKKQRKIKKEIEKNSEKRIKIISLVRDPMSLNVSNFFFHFNIFTNNRDRAEIGEKDILTEFNKIDLIHPLNWFDNEFKEYTGIDVYDLPFDKEKGYSIYSTDRIDLLIIRLENFKEGLSMAMEEFLGSEFHDCNKTEITSRTNSSSFYKKYKSLIKLDIDVLDKIYSTKYARHFYSKEEIRVNKQRWRIK